MFKDVENCVFLWVFVDSGDELRCGFTHMANVSACLNKFVHNKWLKIKW